MRIALYFSLFLLFTGSIYGQYNTPLLVYRNIDFDPFIWDPVNPDNPVYEGTLQWAVRKANLQPGADKIIFSDNLNIILDYELPPITEEVFIDGTQHAAYLPMQSMVRIKGAGNHLLSECFLLSGASNSIIKGLEISNFSTRGIRSYAINLLLSDNNIYDIGIPGSQSACIFTYASQGSLIENNLLGTNTANVVYSNTMAGIALIDFQDGAAYAFPCKNNTIRTNHIENSTVAGIVLMEYFNNSYNIFTKNTFDNNVKAIRFLTNGGSTPNFLKPKPVISPQYTNGTITGTASPNDIIEVFSSTGLQNATTYLTTVSANASGQWQANIPNLGTEYVSAVATDFLGKNSPNQENSSELATTKLCPSNLNCENVLHLCGDYDNEISCNCVAGSVLYYDFEVTDPNQQINITVTRITPSGNVVTTNFNAALSDVTNMGYTGNACQLTANDVLYNQSNTNSFNYTFTSPGTYVLGIFNVTDCPTVHIDFTPDINCNPIEVDCENCIGSFSPQPEPGNRYVIGAWVKEEGAPSTKTSYNLPAIKVNFFDATHTLIGSTPSFVAEGMIIDGWQRIENELSIPNNTVYIDIELISNGGAVYFDDIRMFPFDASMKTYVYDPVNMRLAAELDERHYATFYEYNEEGQLSRIKKETEKGTMTIQETKSNSSK